MARVPNEKAAKAEAMYHDGMKLVDIARKLDVPPGTVRRWKSTYHWDGNSKKKQKNAAAWVCIKIKNRTPKTGSVLKNFLLS